MRIILLDKGMKISLQKIFRFYLNSSHFMKKTIDHVPKSQLKLELLDSYILSGELHFSRYFRQPP